VGDSGDQVVVQGIARLSDPAIKRALSRMFNFELENQGSKRPPFRDEYQAIVKDGAKAWHGPESTGGLIACE